MERPSASRPADHQDWWWIFDPSLSLRARAALVLGGSAVLFTVLFSWLGGHLLQRALEQQKAATFETLAFQLSDKLDRVVYERYRELQLAGAVGPFRRTDATTAERRQLLDIVQSGSREFAWIGFAEPTGRITAATRRLLEDTPAESRPWFLLGRERPFAAGPTELPALARALQRAEDDRSQRFLELAVPVMAENGQFAGVLGAALAWDWARDVQLTVIPESARREHLGVTVYNAKGDVLLDSGGSGWTQPPDPPPLNDPRRFRGSLVEPTNTGMTYVAGFARSRGHREFRGLDWLVVVRQPLELAVAPARSLQRNVAGWGFCFALVLVIITWIAAGRLARRMRAIGVAADRIREGDILTVIPRPPGEGEMARMCAALREMVQEFRRREETSPSAAAGPARPPGDTSPR